jgi:hypothetical protein
LLSVSPAEAIQPFRPGLVEMTLHANLYALHQSI